MLIVNCSDNLKNVSTFPACYLIHYTHYKLQSHFMNWKPSWLLILLTWLNRHSLKKMQITIYLGFIIWLRLPLLDRRCQAGKEIIKHWNILSPASLLCYASFFPLWVVCYLAAYVMWWGKIVQALTFPNFFLHSSICPIVVLDAVNVNEHFKGGRIRTGYIL